MNTLRLPFTAPGRVLEGDLILVRQFKFKRNNDKGGFQWTAESEIERPGFYRGFYAVGKTLADVKEFAALVRLCERTGKLERLSEMHPPGWEKRMQTTWGGNWYLHKEKRQWTFEPFVRRHRLQGMPESNGFVMMVLDVPVRLYGAFGNRFAGV